MRPTVSRRHPFRCVLLLVLAGLWAAGALSCRADPAAGEEFRLVLLGPPGAGKSTTGAQLQERLGVPHISIGDMFRAEKESGSNLGKKLAAIMERGDLVDDWTVFAVLFKRLAKPDALQGFILDGFPRTIAQARRFDEHLRAEGRGLTAAVSLQVSFAELARRLAARGRADDTGEAIRRRHLVFLAEVRPIERFYREQGLLRTIAAEGRTPEQVLEDVLAVVRAAARP
ncbi:MAG: nucleoside monophosphate kinase [Candidatus Riflebacteria bacterium]|nr:nucleoside monophosphate kinase [Candidatus Riflebacteria bacterium]